MAVMAHLTLASDGASTIHIEVSEDERISIGEPSQIGRGCPYGGH